MNPIALPLLSAPANLLMHGGNNGGAVSINRQMASKREEGSLKCLVNDCLNGGVCYKDSTSQASSKCKCALGYVGEKCENLNAVTYSFDDSYIELEAPELDSTILNISFTVITEAENGILLYHGSKSRQHVAVELFKGRVRVSYDIGNAAATTLFSHGRVNDSKF
jgi:slit 2